MTPEGYARLLDTTEAVEVVLPDRRGADWPGLDHLRLDPRTGRCWPVTWLRGPSVLTLLASARRAPRAPTTGCLGRRLRAQRLLPSERRAA
jgi:hypothetical protein